MLVCLCLCVCVCAYACACACVLVFLLMLVRARVCLCLCVYKPWEPRGGGGRQPPGRVPPDEQAVGASGGGGGGGRMGASPLAGSRRISLSLCLSLYLPDVHSINNTGQKLWQNSSFFHPRGPVCNWVKPDGFPRQTSGVLIVSSQSRLKFYFVDIYLFRCILLQ